MGNRPKLRRTTGLGSESSRIGLFQYAGSRFRIAAALAAQHAVDLLRGHPRPLGNLDRGCLGSHLAGAGQASVRRRLEEPATAEFVANDVRGLRGQHGSVAQNLLDGRYADTGRAGHCGAGDPAGVADFRGCREHQLSGVVVHCAAPVAQHLVDCGQADARGAGHVRFRDLVPIPEAIGRLPHLGNDLLGDRGPALQHHLDDVGTDAEISGDLGDCRSALGLQSHGCRRRLRIGCDRSSVGVFDVGLWSADVALHRRGQRQSVERAAL
nr:hypothetical protein [Nocardia abscessus]